MNKQRSHYQCAATRNQADRLTSPLLPCCNLVITKLPHAMRSWKDAQGTVPCSALIEVQANRKHLLKNCGWRLDMYNALLAAPRTVACYVVLLPDRDRHVLMPSHLPI